MVPGCARCAAVCPRGLFVFEGVGAVPSGGADVWAPVGFGMDGDAPQPLCPARRTPNVSVMFQACELSATFLFHLHIQA